MCILDYINKYDTNISCICVYKARMRKPNLVGKMLMSLNACTSFL